MKKEQYENIIQTLLKTGADFAEVYYEESSSKSYEYNDSKIDSIRTNNRKGIGFRIIFNNEYYYSSTNNLDYNNLINKAEKLAKNVKSNNKKDFKELRAIEDKCSKVIISHKDFSKLRRLLQKYV